MAQPSPRAPRLLRGIFLGLAMVLAVRLVQIQVIRHDYYLRCATRQWEKKETLPAPRGNLYDRQGGPLAVSSESFQLSADPRWFRDAGEERRAEALELLAGVLGRDAAVLGRELERSDRHWKLLGEGLQLDACEKEALEETGLVTLRALSQRIYPQGAGGASLIGFLDKAGAGGGGLELSLDDELAGKPGEALVQKDDLGRALRSPRNRVLRQPVRGSDVFLTLDRKVQAIAEAELAAAVERSEARAGCVVVLEPRSGDLLALASWPAPERRDGGYDPAQWFLHPLQSVYEPGSTVKALTSIALMESGGVDESSQVDAEDGTTTIRGFTIRDDKPHPGWRSFREAFTLSSNVCFAKLADSLLTDEQLYSVFRDANFGNRFGLEFPGEQNGILRRPADWSRRSRITLAFGQEMSVTPVQLTAAFGALARGGRLMRPRLIRALRHPDGEWEKREPVFLRKICRESTAGRIRDLMGQVVLDGTGTKAAVPGLTVGGKTGTAQKFEGGQLKRGKYLATFVGMTPLDDPALVIGVFLDEPRYGMHHGGQSAAPAFAAIVARLAVSTDWLRPEFPEEEEGAPSPAGPPVPSFLDMDPDEASLEALREGLPVLLRGQGRRVVAQEPSAGAPLPPGTQILLYLGDPNHPAAEPPSLIGCTLRQARRKALAAGYDLLPEGEGVVVHQGRPRAGVIRVKLGRR